MIGKSSGMSLSKGSLFRHSALGATVGAVCVGLVLYFDAMGIGSMLVATDYAWLYVTLMLIKPMMLLGSAGLGWSLWRQLNRPSFAMSDASHTI